MAGAGGWRRWPERGGWPDRSDGVAGGGGRGRRRRMAWPAAEGAGAAHVGAARGMAGRAWPAAREGRRRERRGESGAAGAARRAVEIDRECVEEKKRGRRPVYYSTALPSARSRALGKDFLKILKYSLPSAKSRALSKDFLKILKYSLPSARSRALGKESFAECQLDGTRQRIFYYPLPSVSPLTLGKLLFYFFYFPYQIFCGVFLHYVDLHVPFWDNYNNVFYS
jgi:hypothetical protein